MVGGGEEGEGGVGIGGRGGEERRTGDKEGEAGFGEFRGVDFFEEDGVDERERLLRGKFSRESVLPMFALWLEVAEEMHKYNRGRWK